MDACLEVKLAPLVTKFLLHPMTPEALLQFEEGLQGVTRELGRDVLEWTMNAGEPDDAEDQPHDVKVGGGGYRRLRDKTANPDVATTFGRITLWRRGYRSWSRGDGEPTIFPLELQLGLVEKTTPALAGRIARRMAEAGATQGTVIDWLRHEYTVAYGVERLRRLCEQVSSSLEEQREHWQTQQLLGKTGVRFGFLFLLEFEAAEQEAGMIYLGRCKVDSSPKASCTIWSCRRNSLLGAD